MLFNIFGQSIACIVVMVGVGVALDYFLGTKHKD